MKAFLLAAGKGTRLRPLTNTIPKCLLPIRNRPLLGIWLDLCKQHEIEEVLINVHAHAQAVREYLANNNHGLKIRIFEEPDLLGSAGTLAANRDWIRNDRTFWVLYADVLTNLNLRAMLKFHATHTSPVTLSVYEVPDPRRCGVVVLDENRVIREFVEKPEHPVSNLAFSGVLLARRELLREIPERRPADIGFDVLPRMTGSMSAFTSNDYFQDIGTPETYRLAQQTWPGL